MYNVLRRLRPITRPSESVRCIATSSIRTRSERVLVPCRGGESISLDIYPAPSSTSAYGTKPETPSLLINLPSGFDAADTSKQADYDSAALAAYSFLPVVQINYRLTSTHRFPTPLWDTLSGYDWIVKNLLPTRPATIDQTSPGRPASTSNLVREAVQQSKVGIYGSDIGGSLALALGLTECRAATSPLSLSEHPARVVAVATKDAITDWPGLMLMQGNISSSGSSVLPHNLSELLKTSYHEGRTRDAFDPLVSPALLFRTAGVELPPRKNAPPWLLPMPSVSGTSELPTPPSTPGHDTPRLILPEGQKAPRYYARRFPPTSMGPAILPLIHLAATPGTMYEHQSTEFARLMRRAMVREVIPSGTGQKMVDEILEESEVADLRVEKNERLKEARLAAEDRCRLVIDESRGERVEQLAEWFVAAMAGQSQ